jgi:hypothetical protein
MRLADFTGLWTIEREIDDLRAGRRGWFRGRARFVPSGGGLAYREEGTLELDGAAPMAATRALLWRGTEGGVEVCFEDGRFFHAFATGTRTPSAEHPCGPDLYRVRYDFRAWPVWRAEWQAQGPRKDYRLLSTYAPLD